MAEVKVGQNEVIMRQGDKGNNFYLIKSGTCDVWIADKDGERRNVRSLAAGSWCGELSLLHLKTRSASIMATSSEVTLLMVNRKTFAASIGDLITKKRGELLPFLTKLSIFADMNEYEMGMLADAAKTSVYKAGDVIHEANKPSDNRFYLVREGTITTPGLNPVKYGRHSYFGHIELLQSSMNSETRRASDATTCVTFRKEDFMKLVPLHAFVREAGQQQLALASGGGGAAKMRGRRFGESAEATQTTVNKPTGQIAKGTKKSPEAIGRIMGAVKQNIIFSRLNEMQLTMLQQAMMEHSVDVGENVITQGEKGNHFFIVDSGELDVFVQGENPGDQPMRVKGFTAGDAFGELALMYNCPRTATIMAKTPAVLWSLDRVSFRMIVLEANTKKATLYENFLEKVQLLSPLDKDQRNRMVDALEEVSVPANQPIITEGDEGTHFYIIVDGEVSITKSGTEGELARRKAGDYFGELSLKTGAPTIASVTAVGNPTKLVRMDRGAFQRLLGPLDTLLSMRKYTSSGAEMSEQGGGEGPTAGATVTAIPDDHAFKKHEGKLTLQDMTVTKGTLGEGAFGKVRRCKINKTGAVFALKQMQKADIVAMGQVEHIMQETQILSKISHPFVTNKYAGFTSKCNLLLIMEFCPGGDLFDQLYKHKAFTVPDTRIFVSQVLLPLEYLHSMSIVHRDLKLENILVSEDGALKLTDFGFAKYIKYRSWTLCGTPEYLAPEIILEKGHGKAVDYWAMGVLFYEMLNGHSPFEAEDHLATYQKILDGSVNYPAKMDSDATDLISKLLQKDISRRYGNLRDGAKDIKDHPFFTKAKFDWNDFSQRGAAFRPIKFDSSKYEWLPADTIVTEAKPCKPEDQANFDGF
uniref:Uncharacterized protein n=1 Tax=Haptolina brevifila TaxID=156173 RepID=A0A7S2FU98_9EUKA